VNRVAASVLIRKVQPGDAEAIVALWQQVFPEYGDTTRPQRDPRANIERKLAFGDGLFWLAQQGDAVIGTAMAGYDGHRGWLYSLGVHPAHRRGGVARALVSHAEAALREMGCPKVNLQVLDTRADAQAFWRALGYLPDAVVSLGRRLD
jgi:ribosomal protein S18 acetylase RimI-like enzyme